MQEEYEVARADGAGLSFAWGCLLTAWRDLPKHEQGRFMIASHLLALLLLIPTAAGLVASMVSDFPYAFFEAAGAQPPLLSEGNLSALPPLILLLALVAAAHLRMAWLVLERDWALVLPLGSLLAAATMTLFLFAALVFVSFVVPLILGVALALELVAISALARWHGRAFPEMVQSLA